MKVLVADDDVVARKVLSAFLKQSNHEVVMVEDGHSAFGALTAPQAPHIGIIDWMMPDVSGPDLCAKLRNHPFMIQPYLLMLSGKKEKVDIVTGLDAGADEFISKPFNIQELQARLRVAERSIQQQLKAFAVIARLQEELAAERARAVPVSISPVPTVVAPAPTSEERPTGVAALEKHQIDTVVAGALRHCGIGDAPRRIHASSDSGRATALGWAGLLLTKEGQWIDLILELDPSQLPLLMPRGRRRPGNEADDIAMSGAKLATSLRDSLRSVLRAMGSEVLVPFPARGLRGPDSVCPDAEESAAATAHHFKVGTVALKVVITSTPCPVAQKTPQQLQPCDVLVQPYPPAAIQEVPLIRAGVVLKDNLIERLHEFVSTAPVELPPIPVHTPTARAIHHHLQASGSFVTI